MYVCEVYIYIYGWQMEKRGLVTTCFKFLLTKNPYT